MSKNCNVNCAWVLLRYIKKLLIWLNLSFLKLDLTQHEVNCKKFQFILTELETLISILKDVVDKILIKSEKSNGISLGIRLSRAFGKEEGINWKLNDSAELAPIL